MARATAAAAGGLLACAVLLLFAGQSAATTTFLFPFIGTFPKIFPVGYLPPIVTIYSKQNSRLNMAVSNDGKGVVLATANYWDAKQLWWKIPAPTSLVDGEGAKYWLVNVATKEAMTSPSYGPVQLIDFNPWNGAQLWVPSPPRPQDDGFYQIKPYTQDSMALNGWGGYAYDGTVIGIYPDTPVSPNTLWATRNVY